MKETITLESKDLEEILVCLRSYRGILWNFFNQDPYYLGEFKESNRKAVDDIEELIGELIAKLNKARGLE